MSRKGQLLAYGALQCQPNRGHSQQVREDLTIGRCYRSAVSACGRLK